MPRKSVIHYIVFFAIQSPMMLGIIVGEHLVSYFIKNLLIVLSIMVAFAMGDDEDYWQQRPFQIVVNGPMVIPPTCSRKRRDSEAYLGDNNDREDIDSDEGDDNGRKRRRRSRSYSPEYNNNRRDRGNGIDDKDRFLGMTGAQIERLKEKEKREDSDRFFDSDLSALVSSGNYKLKSSSFDRFQKLLTELTVSRQKIKDAMSFAFDFVSSSTEVHT